MARHNGRSAKIVVTGPFAAGKTTFIRTISEIEVVSTERGISDDTGAVKPRTTVAMDFGRITVARDLALHLFGTPGQERFDFMWEVLAEGMLGFVLLVDAARPASVDEAQRILEFFTGISAVPFVVAVNRTDGEAPDGLEETRERLKIPHGVRVVPCDARERGDVKLSLVALLEEVLARVEERRREVRR